MKLKKLISEDDQKLVVEAIKRAELNTSGEIRVGIVSRCKKDVMRRAAKAFVNLKMGKTEQHNGVLIYIAINDRKVAIVGDSGINQKVPDDFWESTKNLMIEKFKQGNIVDGLIAGVERAGEQLKALFPYKSGDVDELSNEIVLE